MRALFSELDESTIQRLLETEEFYDAFLRITDKIMKVPNANEYN